MNKPLILIGLFFFFFFYKPLLYAQTNDAGSWISVSLEKKISRAFTFNLSPEIRLNENFSELGMLLSDVSLEYTFRKFLKIGINYRFLSKQSLDHSYNFSNKAFADLTLINKWTNWQTRWRLRIQESDVDMFFSDDLYSRWYLRARGEWRYKYSSRILLLGFSEIFCQLNANMGRPIFDQYRLVLGAEYEWNSRNTIKPFLLYQSELFHNNAQRDFVLGLNLKHTLR